MQKMRRADKEITSKAAIEGIISRSLVCRLALADENQPYIVPLCFGYKDNSLYFHSAVQGKKIDIIKKNNRVCFEFDIDSEVIKADKACEWGLQYKSVVGFGQASFLEDSESKRRALDIIMKQYSGESSAYPEAKLKHTVIIKVDIQHMTGKQAQ
jgi:nitroimidazol reductase NimA-like FMN-containing flavoprotein (pyridoxamine 5'-phosphate oxidase superfamily)